VFTKSKLRLSITHGYDLHVCFFKPASPSLFPIDWPKPVFEVSDVGYVTQPNRDIANAKHSSRKRMKHGKNVKVFFGFSKT